MIDTFDFLTTRKAELGRTNRALAAELIDEHADRAWDEHSDADDEGELGDGLSIIDGAEFKLRYVLNDDEPAEGTREFFSADDQRLIATLKRHGYMVEDMGKDYGPAWRGQYRWLHQRGDFQDWDTSDSERAAWLSAWDHFTHRN